MAEIRRLIAELNEEMESEFKGTIDQAKRKIALDALSSVVRKSPVRTGQFRSNWMVELGQPGSRTIEALRSAQDVITSGADTVATAPTFTPVAIYNALPYAEELEQGRSDQAPNGMVAVTVSEIESQFR